MTFDMLILLRGQYIRCHLIFDIKMDAITRYVAVGLLSIGRYASLFE